MVTPMPAFDLNGKVALVTGAARGIGFETARQMQMRGASVAVLDLDPQQAADAAERIGERTIGIGADVTDQGAMMAAVAEVVDKFGGLDCVVANAGIAQKQLATVYGMSGEEWERVLEVDLLGVFRTVRAALPQIVERRGQVAMVSSVYAFANGFGNSPYAVAKPGVEAFGRGAAGGARPSRRLRHRRLLRLGRHDDGPGRLRPARRRAPQQDDARSSSSSGSSPRRRRRPSCAASKSAPRASSRRSGGATTPPSAA